MSTLNVSFSGFNLLRDGIQVMNIESKCSYKSAKFSSQLFSSAVIFRIRFEVKISNFSQDVCLYVSELE